MDLETLERANGVGRSATIAPSSSEKNLLMELEVKYDAFHRQLEESFVAKEKKLIEDLQAMHAAAYHKLEDAALERERVLLARLAAARRQLWAVVLGALLLIAVILDIKGGQKDPAQPAPVTSSASQPLAAPLAAPVTVPAAATATVAAVTLPVSSEAIVKVPVPVAAVKTGNGGNFSSARSTVKK